MERFSDDIVSDMKRCTNACQDLSHQFLRVGRNRWIEIAIDENWTHNLRAAARSIAFETWRKRCLIANRVVPVMGLVELDDLVQFQPEDHEYFRQYGRDLNRVDLFDVCKFRGERNGREYPILANPPPSVTATTTDDLRKLLRATALEMEQKAKAFGRRSAAHV